MLSMSGCRISARTSCPACWGAWAPCTQWSSSVSIWLWRLLKLLCLLGSLEAATGGRWRFYDRVGRGSAALGISDSSIPLVQGFRDLLWLPIEQYRKDGRLMRGLQRGAASFGSSTASAALELSNRLVQAIQVSRCPASRPCRAGRVSFTAPDPDPEALLRVGSLGSWLHFVKNCHRQGRPSDWPGAHSGSVWEGGHPRLLQPAGSLQLAVLKGREGVVPFTDKETVAQTGPGSFRPCALLGLDGSPERAGAVP